MINDLENQGVDPQNYVDGWNCFCLFIRDMEKNKLADEQAKIYLIDILKIINLANYIFNLFKKILFYFI